jgi:ribosome-associated translation inhibitor RaiA
MTTSGSDAPGSSLTARLRAITVELQELERTVISGDLDSRVLSEFRNAVDHIRNTAWTVQQWVDAREQSGDPYAVLPALAAQRVHRATRLASDLCLDLQSVEVTAETEGMGDLYRSVDDLHRRLERLLNKAT